MSPVFFYFQFCKNMKIRRPIIKNKKYTKKHVKSDFAGYKYAK